MASRNTTSSSSSSSSDTSFPIVAISILGILTTTILLVSYYLFVIKCCMNWQSTDAIFRLRSRRRGRHHDDREDQMRIHTSSSPERQGLEESVIQSIPILHYLKIKQQQQHMSFHECAVCLNEFQEEEKLRVLPGCFHAFHIDCIDVWLQTHANCPICRAGISAFPSSLCDMVENRGFAVELCDQASNLVIDIADGNDERDEKAKPFSSMGDECIDVRRKDEGFLMQPIRRSFSMDSSANRRLYLSVREALQRSRRLPEVGGSGEGSSSSGNGGAKVRRLFFSFGHGRSSRSSSVLPVQFEM